MDQAKAKAISKKIDALSRAASKRMKSADPALRGLRPAEAVQTVITDILEAVSPKTADGKYKLGGKVGVWRTGKRGQRMFWPDDGSGVMGVPKAFKAAPQKKRKRGKAPTSAKGGSGSGRVPTKSTGKTQYLRSPEQKASDAKKPSIIKTLMKALSQIWKRFTGKSEDLDTVLAAEALLEAKMTRADLETALAKDEADLKKVKKGLEFLKNSQKHRGKEFKNLSTEGGLRALKGLQGAIANKKKLLAKMAEGRNVMRHDEIREEKARLPKYGEVYRKMGKSGRATIVVRGIFKARGDTYHVRVLKGAGKESDERARGNVLWKDNFADIKSAVKAAQGWIKSPEGKKKLARISESAQIFEGIVPADQADALFGDIQTLCSSRLQTTLAEEEADWNAFNTKLSKLIKGLKKTAHAKSIQQNYKGTGSQKFRRQLWIRFHGGLVTDLWLDRGFLSYGGVLSNSLPKQKVMYGDRTPEEVYREVSGVIAAWVAQNSVQESREEADALKSLTETNKELLGYIAKLRPLPVSSLNAYQKKEVKKLLRAKLIVQYLSSQGHGTVISPTQSGLNALA